MVVEIDESLITEAIDDIDEISDGLDDFTDKRGKNSAYEAIERSVREDLVNPVLERARQLGKQHVGDRVKYIQPAEPTWRGDTLVAGLESENDVVLSHEYGSGQYTTNGPYRIEPNDGNDHLVFRVDGRLIVTEFVVHPGVRGKRFMQQAVQEQADEMAQDALDEAQEALFDSINF